VVEEAARGGDEHVDAGAEGALLGTHRDAAEDRRGADPRVAGELLEVLDDLGGQLAGGGEHEHLDAGLVRLVEAVEDREEVGGGLAAARHRAREDVAPLEEGGDGHRLDRGRRGEAEVADGADQGGVEAEGGKGHLLRSYWRTEAPLGAVHMGWLDNGKSTGFAKPGGETRAGRRGSGGATHSSATDRHFSSGPQLTRPCGRGN
jgi:hypothetical protein